MYLDTVEKGSNLQTKKKAGRVDTAVCLPAGRGGQGCGGGGAQGGRGGVVTANAELIKFMTLAIATST
jgi:hypothetical protein